MKHLEKHPEYRDDCLICKLTTVSISAAATPTSRSETVATIEREKRWQKDIPAYRRLRKSGLQPKSVDGCAALEAHANTSVEVQRGAILPPRAARTAEAIVKEAGVAQ